MTHKVPMITHGQSIQSTFLASQLFYKSHYSERTAAMLKSKRLILTTNSSITSSTFDHVEETTHVYLTVQKTHQSAQHVWHKGAEETIIRLLTYLRDGPYVRILLMELAEWDMSCRLTKFCFVQSRAISIPCASGVSITIPSYQAAQHCQHAC